MSHIGFHKDTTAGHWTADYDDVAHTATVELNGRVLDPHPVPVADAGELKGMGFEIDG